jgi:signal transduction histidine kinase/CheY-like chemotaxis protein
MIHKKCGEFLGCENHGDGGNICGNTKFCQNCGLYSGIRKVLAGGNSLYDLEDQVSLSSENGFRKVWLSFSIESLLIDGTRNAILALTDITKQKEAQTLESKLVIAQKTAAIKQNFLSSMSHEMRTPLNGIIGITDILKKTDLNEDQRQYLNILEDSSDTLLNMINSVLDLSKIESGKVSVHEVLVDIRKFCEKITSLFGNIAKTQNLEFICNIHENFPDHFISDENKLNQILNNLLGNAIKFTERGHLSITARLLKSNEDDFILRFDVTDTGIGIPHERIDEIFDEFSQIDDVNNRKEKGTGLGLAITRNLVNLLGGDIYVESEPGKGSNFWFTIRAMKPSVFSKELHNLDEFSAFTPKDINLSVLIVEDMKVNRLVVTLMLQGLGCVIDTAENGLEALRKITKNSYDIVLMDIQMPVMDGVTAVKELRNLNVDLPVIIGLSAQAMEGDAEKYIAEGMDDYLTKPIKSNILGQKLSYWKAKIIERKNQTSI